MSRIQQVLFQMDTGYLGHPYYVTGNALYQALAQRVDERTRRTLGVSNGIFFPKEYGDPPSWHSQSSLGKVGTSLPPVETYDDLFLLRDAAHRWLKPSRPRDAHNAQPIQSHGGRLAFDPITRFGRPPEMKSAYRSVKWLVQCYLHSPSSAPSDGVLPVSDATLDGVQVGGARNYGFGRLSLVESQLIDLDELDYSRIATADEHDIELVSPYVLSSEYPGADDQSIPWWWDVSNSAVSSNAAFGRDTNSDGPAGGPKATGLRRRTEQLVDDGEVYALETIDHGQRVTYAGSDPVETARNGVCRVGTHSRFGFGELRVRPASDDRVPNRSMATQKATKADAAGGDA